MSSFQCSAVTILVLVIQPLNCGAQELMTDVARLQGEWYLREVIHKGERGVIDENGTVLTFEGNHLKVFNGDRQKTVHFRIDDDTFPKQLDLGVFSITSDEKGSGPDGYYYRMIYSLESRTLTLGMHEEWADYSRTRPRKMGGTSEDRNIKWILRRLSNLQQID